MTRFSTFTKWSTLALGAALAVACDDGGGGDGDGNGADAGPQGVCEVEGGQFCFEAPDVVMTKGNDMPANWNCTPDAVTTSAIAITVNGTVNDFQTDAEVNGATVDAFVGLDFSAVVATGMSDAMGAYSLSLPSGMAKSRMNFRTKHPDALDTYALNIGVDVASPMVTLNRGSVSKATANAIAAFIGVDRTEGLGVLAGSVVDCDGDEVKGAIATVASASAVGQTAPSFVAGPQVYYFSGGTTSLPVRRTSRITTNVDGLFVIIEIPPTSGSATNFLQVWGYKSDADKTAGTLSLVSELESPVIADSVISVSMEPNQGQ